ncbi:hypothetical protein CC2G_003265 [Coprinopsis cinerea AmutBmut pab1-1]|nr:hypothetical protein CC2G_003265 [Coprinopsis cinerea AmutBmut pab1-1]
MGPSGDSLYTKIYEHGVEVVETSTRLAGRQVPPPYTGPSPVVVMGAMNASFVTDGILYGVHLVLFAMCCYILLTPGHRRIQWFVLGAICTMFAISTADIGLSIKLSTTDLWVLLQLPPQSSIDKMPPKAVLFVTNNLIADILLFHRCWVIWGRPRIILWIALICLTADTIWGYMGHAAKTAAWQHTFRPLYLWTVFALNITVTAAAVGRIYWVYLVGISPVERRLKRIYRAIISTLVESAAVYSACILVFLLWSQYASQSAYWVLPLTMMTRLVAIMPTLMIVQVGLSGRCCHPRGHDSKHDSVILDTVISQRRDQDHDIESGMHVEERGLPELSMDLGHSNHERKGEEVTSMDEKRSSSSPSISGQQRQ